MGRAKDELEMVEPSDRSTDGGNRGRGDPDSAAKEEEEEKRRSGEDEGGGGGVNPSVERIFEGVEVPPWRRQLTVRALVVSFTVSVMFAFIVMKLNLTVGIIPSLNVSAGLLGFFFIKTWTKVLAKSGLLQAVPFTRQENTVIQTCVVASSGIAFSGTFPSSFALSGCNSNGANCGVEVLCFSKALSADMLCPFREDFNCYNDDGCFFLTVKLDRLH